MLILGPVVLVLFLITYPFPVHAQSVEKPTLDSLKEGQVLQGSVVIRGTNQVEGFLYSEMAFSLNNDPTGTWFLIATNNQPVVDGVLSYWETTSLTDGDYIVRLRVYLLDGSYLDALVSNLRVRNSTPIETETALQTPAGTTLFPTQINTSPPYPTPTSLGANPIALSQHQVINGLIYGALSAVLLIAVLSLVIRLRRR